MPTLQQITYFVKLADVLHYTRAAENLHISQPTLSYAISKLEKELDVEFFLKKGKKFNLTPYGKAFLPYARQALETLAFGLQKVEALRRPEQSTINLGYIYSVSGKIFPQIINSFSNAEDEPKVAFQFYQGIKADLVPRLIEGHLNLVIAGAYDMPRIQKAKLFSQELFLVLPGGHPLSSRKELSLEEVKTEPFILPKHTSGLREVLDRTFAQLGIVPHIIFEADECNAMLAFVSTGVGMAIMPAVPNFGKCVSVHRIVNPVLCRDVALLWAQGRALPPSVERFKKFILSLDWNE